MLIGIQFRSAKRAQLFNTVSITTEEAPASVYNSTNQFQLSATATANLGHSSSSDSIASTITTPSPPIEQDTMMIYDDLTDEEESLKTPCNTNYDYIPTDLGEDVENGGYTGQLERGWSEMFNEYNI